MVVAFDASAFYAQFVGNVVLVNCEGVEDGDHLIKTLPDVGEFLVESLEIFKFDK